RGSFVGSLWGFCTPLPACGELPEGSIGSCTLSAQKRVQTGHFMHLRLPHHARDLGAALGVPPASLSYRTGRSIHSMSGAHVCAISLPPLLGEPFGGCECLISVGIDRHPRELAVFPHPHDPPFQLEKEVGGRTPVADLEGVYDPVAEVLDVIDLDPVLVQRSDPPLVEPTNRRWTPVA